jgi:hypothetical protein
MALSLAFIILVALLGLTAVTLISQRDRTVLLNKQIATLLGETTLVLKQAAPLLDALPAQSSTITSGARSAADLVSQARPLVGALSAAGLPDTVGAAGQLLQSIDQPGAVAHTLANLDELATTANQIGVVPRLRGGLDDLATLVSLQRALLSVQRRTLAVQVATLQTGDRTNHLTAEVLTTARRALNVVGTILSVARQTLTHAANIDRKTGPAPPASSLAP